MDLAETTVTVQNLFDDYDCGEQLFDIAQVKKNYLDLRLKLERVITGVTPVDEMELPTVEQSCLFRWYNNYQNSTFKEDKLASIKNTHGELYTCIHRIGDMIVKGEKKQLESLLNKYQDIRRELFDSLDELYA